LRDFLRLPTYVRDANDDPEFIEEFKLELRYSSMNPGVFSDYIIFNIPLVDRKKNKYQISAIGQVSQRKRDYPIATDCLAHFVV
jgi:hypothetical protein